MRLMIVVSLLINVAVLVLVGSAGGQSPAMWRSRWSATAGVFRAEAGKLKDPPGDRAPSEPRLARQVPILPVR